MRIEKLLTWITPLMLGALLGLYEILHGLFYVVYGTQDQKRDYPLEIILGLLIMAVCLGGALADSTNLSFKQSNHLDHEINTGRLYYIRFLSFLKAES